MKVNLNIKINPNKINEINKVGKMALKETVEQLRSDIYADQVMPRDTGTLQNESTFVDDTEINNYKVKLVHQTPYARRLYFNPQYDFRQDKNKNAKGKWLEDWLDGGAKSTFCYDTMCQIYSMMLKNKK